MPIPAFAPVLRPWLLFELESPAVETAVAPIPPSVDDAAEARDVCLFTPSGLKSVLVGPSPVRDGFDVCMDELLTTNVDESGAVGETEDGVDKGDDKAVVGVLVVGVVLEGFEVAALVVG